MSSSSTFAEAPEQALDTLNLEKRIDIEAPIEIVWESLIEEMGATFAPNKGVDMSMKVEAWPGGRWYRDLGNGAGHLWGHVQVIKPPKLLEVCGPLFMSYPAMNHVQYRLTAEGESSTHLKLTHRALGFLDPEHTKGVHSGWQEILNNVRDIAARRMKKV
jgi:uncharacterized protein YndB with AHSA1/START domain